MQASPHEPPVTTPPAPGASPDDAGDSREPEGDSAAAPAAPSLLHLATAWHANPCMGPAWAIVGAAEGAPTAHAPPRE